MRIRVPLRCLHASRLRRIRVLLRCLHASRLRRIRVLRAAALVSFAVACSSATPTTAPTEADAGADAEPRPAPPIDPALFDCTSLAKPPLPRRATTTPECLRDPKCQGRFVTGHRGAGGDLGRIAPEDTVAAYRAAIALGVDFVETDPRPSADGVIVNVHDTTVDRVAEGTGEVAAMTLAQLKALRLKTDKLTGDFSCERIATLEEVLSTCKGRAVVLIDANKTDRVEALVDLVKKTDTLEWAVFDTDSTDKIDRALTLEPRLMIMPRVKKLEEIATIKAKYASHVPVLVELDSALFPKGAAEVRALGSRAFTNVFVADVGVRVGDDRKVYLGFYEAGADALQSDLPDEVLRALGRSF
ncbi:MAG: glycerophosphodiester phosphodiesterase family protein [Deltaproteobacteria bacterium]|nr:glycerophosphodiester phosphodiesterase family protein [Deltaproteobacteria bacterium]